MLNTQTAELLANLRAANNIFAPDLGTASAHLRTVYDLFSATPEWLQSATNGYFRFSDTRATKIS